MDTALLRLLQAVPSHPIPPHPIPSHPYAPWAQVPVLCQHPQGSELAVSLHKSIPRCFLFAMERTFLAIKHIVSQK